MERKLRLILRIIHIILDFLDEELESRIRRSENRQLEDESDKFYSSGFHEDYNYRKNEK